MSILYIAHRGNQRGANPQRENEPLYIMESLEAGFDAEIDVWYDETIGLRLGHDAPMYLVEESFLENEHLWCHAKNIEALFLMLKNPKIHCFWHEKDKTTLTSKNYVWTYPGVKALSGVSVAVMPETVVIPDGYEAFRPKELSGCAGICSDFPFYIKKEIERDD